MTGGVPYHLRTNKSIDRQIFFEVLNLLNLPENVQSYKYISLGGPMLEDHHSLHNVLGMVKLESLERDEAVFTRQEFNKNFSCINCNQTSIGEFVFSFERDSGTVVWLDYTDTNWGHQMREFNALLSKLDIYDICKITINANPDSINNTDSSPVDVFKYRASCKFLNENINENDVSGMDRLARTLEDMVHAAADDAFLGAEGLFFKPLTTFRYIDNRHQMLTITGIVLNEESEGEQLLKDSHLNVMDHVCDGWGDVHEISVPDLTVKERLEVNKYLPCSSVDDFVDKLPFRLHKNTLHSKRALENYVKYYRYIPSFHRIAI